MAYRFIQENSFTFGLRWLLRKFNLSPNAYYNFLKGIKDDYRVHKKAICDIITEIYHETEGRLGYRSMQIFLARKGIYLSRPTVHKYMNKELGLYSIVMRKKPAYRRGTPHEIFPNLLKQNFDSDDANQVWCTDFTYMNLTDGSRRYNCSIIDLHDRSVVASLNGKEITSHLAINTLKKAFAACCQARTDFA